MVKSGLFHLRQKGSTRIQIQKFKHDVFHKCVFYGLCWNVISGQPDDEDEDGYNSAGTDELFASRKPATLPSLPGAPLQEKQTLNTDKTLSENGVRKRKTQKKDQVRKVERETEEDTRKSLCAEKKEECVQKSSQKQDGSSNNHSKKKAVVPDLNPPSSDLDEDGDEEGDESESADSCSDSEYEAMFLNATCMEISFTDLQRLAEESQQTSESIPSINGTKFEKETDPESVPAKQRVPKKGTMPEEILASIMGEGDSSDEEEQKKKKKSKQKIVTQLPAFQGTKTLKDKTEAETTTDDEEEVVVHQAVLSFPDKAKSPLSSSSSSSSIEEDEEEEDEKVSAETGEKTATPPSPSSESSSEEEEEEEKVTEKTASRVNLGAKEEEELQKKANMRRLAAIQQRQKKAEENKKLIQGALANLVCVNCSP